MGDRTREWIYERTPGDAPPDAVDQFSAQRDISDFAPTMKGGVNVGAGAAAISGSGENLLANPGFEAGVGGWTVISGGTAASEATILTEGSLSCVVTPIGTSPQLYLQADPVALPADAQSLHISGDVRYHFTFVEARQAGLQVSFFDELGVQTGICVTGVPTLVADTWTSFSADIPIPAGSVTAVYAFITTSGSTTTIPSADLTYFDNAYMGVGASFVGLHRGVGYFSGGIFGQAGGAVSLPDQASTVVLGASEEWGGGNSRVIFNDDASWTGLTLCITGTVSGRMANAGAAARNGEIDIEISTDNGSTWNVAAGGRFVLTASTTAGTNNANFSRTWTFTATPAAVNTAVNVRAVFRQTTGVIGDCSWKSGILTAFMFPALP